MLCESGVAMDVIGTEPGISYHAIANYREFINERLRVKQATAPDKDHSEKIKAELVRRLNGQYPLDPTPLIARASDQFITTEIRTPMPGAWCVIGHDEISIDWLKLYAHTFKQNGVVGCFLISAATEQSHAAMKAIVPVPLYSVNGKALWHIHALAEYPIVLVGQRSAGQGG